ncbi:acid phosphatase protein [Colletotrichum tabaci]|uniref:Acid phosphatase protein n=1 Tax=Colletotrichum tabaci TaxID=1209068 RepID=A0AAV9T0Z3_9PEZI
MSHRQHSHNLSTSSSDTVYGSQPNSPFIQSPDNRQSLGSYKPYQSAVISAEDVPPSEPALSNHGESRFSVPSRWSKMSERTHIKSESFSPSGSWTFEIVSLCVAVLAAAAIVGVLAAYDGKPLASWRFQITINAVIALLATVATATMAVVLSSGISQLKWIHFKMRREPLSDMEVFDDASRGTWGALMMLVKLRGGFLGSFGAFVAISTLAFSPFAQQIATFHARTTNSTAGATNLRAQEYLIALSSQSASEGFIPILPFKAAVYNGLFAENGKPWLSLPVNCQTGNCTWEPFETLGVCNTCVDLSEFMIRACEDGSNPEGDMTECGWSIPVGAKLKTHADVFSMTPIFPQGLGDMSYSTIMKLVFMGTENQGGIAGELAPWARQCTLQACVQTLSSSVVNGELREKILHVETNDTVATATQESLEPIYISGVETKKSYPINMKVMMGMRSWFSDLFRNGSASRNQEVINKNITTPDNVIVNLTVGISSGETFFDTDIVQAFYWNYYEYPAGIDMLMNDLATSVTVSFRSFNGTKVTGVAHTVESYIHVEWSFLTLPLFTVLLTVLFLCASIYQTYRHKASLWKSSVLATLVHGLDRSARERLEDLGGLREQQKEAKTVKVQLDEDEGGLLRLSKYDDI